MSSKVKLMKTEVELKRLSSKLMSSYPRSHEFYVGSLMLEEQIFYENQNDICYTSILYHFIMIISNNCLISSEAY